MGALLALVMTPIIPQARAVAACLGLLSFVMCHADDGLKFSFGGQNPPAGFVQITPANVYAAGSQHGFLDATGVKSSPGSCSSDKPFYFTVNVPEGDYDVKLTLGGDSAPSATTVKAEGRRLVLENVKAGAGETMTKTFTVNVRTSDLKNGGSVHLKKDETGSREWDNQLTLEFNGPHPAVSQLEITPASHAITLFIAADSTVTDQRAEPWAGWGQLLPRFFKQGVAVANNAESGETLKSFESEKRYDKVMETIQPGDYLFIQFTHNDQKPGGGHLDAMTTFPEELKKYIAAARAHGAHPVLVTSMERRRFDAGGKIVNTLEQYPDAERNLAKEENIPLIDLTEMSTKLFEAMGPQGTLHAFVHFPVNTFPGQAKELKDDTHFTNYGACELAKCVVEGIKANIPELAKYLVDDVPAFDPSHPDSFDTFDVPMSPSSSVEEPAHVGRQ